MKKVNFEAGERVDAPDANALSDVVHEELNRIISHMMLRSGYINPNVSGSLSHNYSELGTDWALESLRAITFGHDFEITTQPDSGAGRYQITVSIADAAIIDGGNFVGDSPENPSVDLSGFADAAIGQYTYLMGRVKYKAGVAENRARWRSDLNPPREEIYRANTRRIPVFDARLYTEDELPPASDGWFKIAKITRTPETGNNLKRFRFEDMRFIPTEGGHPSQRVSAPNQELTHKGLLKEITIPLGRFGRGITQQIGGTDTLIAQAVFHYEVLPSKANARLNVIHDNLFSTYNTSLLSEVTARTGRPTDFLTIFQRVIRDNYEGDTQVLPSMNTVGDFILELTRVINEIKYGQDLFGGEDPDSLNISGIRSKRTLSWRRNIGRTSLAANNTDFVIGFAVDSACNELMPIQAFATAFGLSSSLFLARYLLNVKDLAEGTVNPSHHAVFTGFMGESEYKLTDAVFGGTEANKGSPTFRKHGGILVRGASPAATGQNTNTLTGLSDLVSSLTGTGFVSALKGRTIFGNGAVVRKHSAGAPLVWADAINDSQPDTELTIDGLNFTDLCPIFSWDEFIEDTTVQDGISVSPTYGVQATQYLNDSELADGPLLYANRGGLTVQNNWFIAFHNGANTLSGNITHRVGRETGEDDLITRPALMQSSAISIEMVHQDFAKPIVFKSVNFLRYKGAISGDTNREMITINAGESISGQQYAGNMTVPQVIFDGCFFADWAAVGDANGGLSVQPQQPNLFSFFEIQDNISHLVTFKNCIFKIASLELQDARLENCTFLPSGTLFSDPILAQHPQRRTSGANLAAGDRAKFFLKQKPESSLTAGDRVHANTVSASDLQLMPHGQFGTTLGQQVVEVSNNLQRHLDSDRFVQRDTDMQTDIEVDSILPIFSAYFADTAGKQTSPLNVVQFRAVVGNEEAQTIEQTQQTNRVVLESAGYTKLSNTLPMPTIADRAKVGSTQLNPETVFLSHSSYQGEMVDSTREQTQASVGAILKEPIRAPFTLHGNLVGYHGAIGYFGEQVAMNATARTRGFTVETPIDIKNDAVLAYADRLKHPYMSNVDYSMGFDAEGNHVDNGGGLPDLTQRDTHKFYMTAASGEITAVGKGGMLQGRYNEESHIGASVCRLSTQSEEAFQPELAAMAGVTRHTTTSLRMHGVIALGAQSGTSLKDRLFVRVETGAGDSMYRDIEFSTVFGDDVNSSSQVMGDVITTPRGSYTPAGLYSRSTRDANNDIGLIELDLLSSYNPQGGDGQAFVASSGVVNGSTRCHLASMLFSQYAQLGKNSLAVALEATSPRQSEGHLRSAFSIVSTHAVTHVPSLNDNETTCREVRLSLVPVNGALNCARFYIMAEKIHQDFSITRGLLRTRDANGNILRNDPEHSVYSDSKSANAFVASSASAIASGHGMSIEFVVDLYLHA